MAADESDYAQGIWKESPNFGYDTVGQHGRPQAITGIVMHGTAGGGAVSWFQNPASKVSAHYVVDVDGLVTQCVRDDDVAWHAGEVTANSTYAGTDPNRYTIGIEHVRDTTNSSPLTAAQQAASSALVTDLRRRHGPLPLIPHDAIDVGRVCPGPGFPLAAIDKEATPVANTPVVELAPWPYTFNQLNDWTADGQPDENAQMDCGPESLCQIIKHLTDVELPADFVKDTEKSQGYVGYTTFDDHITFMRRYVNTAAGYLDTSDADTARQHIMAWLPAGTPALVLLYWDRKARTGGHFVVATGYFRDGGLVLANPWGGKREVINPADFKQAYQGGIARINRKRAVALVA